MLPCGKYLVQEYDGRQMSNRAAIFAGSPAMRKIAGRLSLPTLCFLRKKQKLDNLIRAGIEREIMHLLLF